MSRAPLSVKLACKSWQQLSAIHSRDLSRGAFFLKTKKPPPLGTVVRIALTLPSGSTVQLEGEIQTLLAAGEMGGRGPGIDISLRSLPQSVMWLIESALSSAGVQATAAKPAPAPAQAPPVPQLEEGDEWVTAEADLVQTLWQELNGMSKMNAFQLLGLAYSAGDGEVRAAFGALSKKYHPDRFTQYESFEIRELANEVFIQLRDAYRAIADVAGRQKVLRGVDPRALAAKPPPIPPQRQPHARPPASPPANPPPMPAKERVKLPLAAPPEDPSDHYPTDNRARAVAPPPPMASDPSTPLSIGEESSRDENRVGLGLRILEGGNYEQALRILRVELRKSPGDVAAAAGIELAEGRLALVAGDKLEAAQRFEAALDIDPSNERAAREIAEMRRQATSQRRGLLSKLMKKV